ncbi:hypothetical protein [Paenibacillus phytorum]|nr:hypothetical protein [Paenibacillus phytorum]
MRRGAGASCRGAKFCGAVNVTDGGSKCVAGCCGAGNTGSRYGAAGGKQHSAAERSGDSETDCCRGDASIERDGYGEAGADCNASACQRGAIPIR